MSGATMKSVAAMSAMVALVLVTVVDAQCRRDIECKGDRICVNGECVDPQPDTTAGAGQEQLAPMAAVPQSEPEEAAKVQPYDPKRWTLWINPLGFLQFGPTIGTELRVGSNVMVGTHFRYAAMGLMYNAIEGGYNNEVLQSSGAAGLSLKYHVPLGSKPHSFYYGMFGEYAWGGHDHYEVTGYDNSTSEETLSKVSEARSQSGVLGGTLGMRWWVGSERKVLLNLGVLAGVAREIRDSETIVATNQTREYIHDNVFFGMLELGIGIGK